MELQKLEMLQGLPIEQNQELLCVPIVQYVDRTEKELLLNHALQEGIFSNDPYIIKNQIQSLLCIPLIHLGKLIGMLYLENRLTKDAFTASRLKVLSLLTSQMAISIENAMFYAELENKVQERTRALQEAQQRLIQHEKMASLGLMTTGIAHEIKNPLNFVLNFSKFSTELTAELEALILQNQSEFRLELFQELKTIFDQLRKFTNDIFVQGKRIDGIVTRMVEHTRGAFEVFVSVNIYSLLEESIELSMKEARSKYPGMAISLEKEFDGSIETLEIAGQDIKRVLQNLISNACWALNQKKMKLGDEFKPLLSIKTQNLGKSFEIRIRDNGIGIAQKALDKIFTPFYTTKKTGEGVGLGLSLSHSIVVQEHEGTLVFDSKEGEYTEFMITLPLR